MTNYIIEKTTEKDWDELEKVFTISLKQVSNHTDEEWAKFHKTLKNYSFPRYDSYAYKIDNKIVAYISIYKSTIEMLYVLPKYMRQRIGTKLLLYILENYKETLEIGVVKGQDIAMHLYTKYGFIQYGESDYDISGVYYPHYLLRREQ